MRTGYYAAMAMSRTDIVEVHSLPARPRFLHLVNQQELSALENALRNGQLPADLEWKLSKLETDSFMHQFIAQNCRVLSMMLMAEYAGMFRINNQSDRDEVLRVLAYVRKDEDAIPDFTPGGFNDDLHEVRTVINRLQAQLAQFKAWRLCHQVPAMWHN